MEIWLLFLIKYTTRHLVHRYFNAVGCYFGDDDFTAPLVLQCEQDQRDAFGERDVRVMCLSVIGRTPSLFFF